MWRKWLKGCEDAFIIKEEEMKESSPRLDIGVERKINNNDQLLP